MSAHRKIRFDQAYKVDAASGCWIWVSFKSWRGYGVYFYQGKVRSAHRLSYQWAKGDIPQGMQIDHLCRNRLCVNPNHLEPVSNAENTRRGLLAKLDMVKAEEIRSLYDSGNVTQKQLAAAFLVTQNTISRVVRRVSWV